MEVDGWVGNVDDLVSSVVEVVFSDVVVVVVPESVVPILHPQSASQLDIQSSCSGHQRVPSTLHVISKFP